MYKHAPVRKHYMKNNVDLTELAVKVWAMGVDPGLPDHGLSKLNNSCTVWIVNAETR